MNQKLEQYLQFFVDYRQKNWLEQLVITKFVVNNKTYLTTKISLFMANYGRELRIEANIKRKKGGESNRVCRKNKESSRESWGGIKESSRENKETSR